MILHIAKKHKATVALTLSVISAQKVTHPCESQYFYVRSHYVVKFHCDLIVHFYLHITMDNNNDGLLLDILDDSAISDSSFCSGDDQDSIETRNESGIFYDEEMILSSDDLIEEMPLPTQEEFESRVRSNVLTSTDPSENLADRLDKILTPSRSLSKSF